MSRHSRQRQATTRRGAPIRQGDPARQGRDLRENPVAGKALAPLRQTASTLAGWQPGAQRKPRTSGFDANDQQIVRQAISVGLRHPIPP
ncbi:hypothetical protein TRIHO_23990 [Tritonibacter horizontis]|uniref:Uncharacterized protein n=1 Tax=Tritonibacter horizontis TaxID=1768241 RepID=A0A132BXG4_9RHOB|nr:hypothetical protein TRIHO_23990 [Tritonibacter horizontis]